MRNYYANYVAFMTIVQREITRFMRIWVQTLLPPAVTMTLYFVIFGHFIGSQIGEMGGYTYMQYIAPGLIMMSVLTNSYANVVSSFFGTKYQGNVQELLIAPVPPSIILAGYVIGGVLRGLITGIIVTGIALLFTHLRLQHPFVSLLVILGSSLLFSTAGFINAVFARKFDDISIVPTFVLTPLTYLGGVFYSVSLLSPFWRHLSLANPVLYMVSGFRYGILGTSDLHWGFGLSVIIFFVMGSLGFALYLLQKGTGLRT